MWTEAGGMVGLGELPGGAFDSSAMAISADGSIVVGESSVDSGGGAFIWDAENGMRQLDQVLTDDFGLDLTGWTLIRAKGISDDGFTIVGQGLNPSGENEGWIVTIPEPSTALLLALELVGIAAGRRHSKPFGPMAESGHRKRDGPRQDRGTGAEADALAGPRRPHRVSQCLVEVALSITTARPSAVRYARLVALNAQLSKSRIR